MRLIAFAALMALMSCAPQESNTLVYGRGGDSVGLDPALETDGESFKVCDNIYQTLVTFKPEKTEVIPELAESWEISDDGLTWTFHLRRDVRFHDGTQFGAEAAVFSLGRQFKEDHPSHRVEGAYQYWNSMSMSEIVRDVRAVDEYTLEIELSRPNAPFLSNLAMNFCAIVSPTAVRRWGDDYPRHPVGTGPFRFVEWIKDDRVVLEKNPNYWGKPPSVNRLIFRSIPENSVRLIALTKGSIHGMDNLVPDFIPNIEADPNLQLLTQAGMNVGYLAMNMDRPPFHLLDVRRAINHAVNKQALVDNLYQGMAIPAVNPIPPTLWSYNEEVKGYAYDPERARALLAEAGFPDGFSNNALGNAGAKTLHAAAAEDRAGDSGRPDGSRDRGGDRHLRVGDLSGQGAARPARHGPSGLDRRQRGPGTISCTCFWTRARRNTLRTTSRSTGATRFTSCSLTPSEKSISIPARHFIDRPRRS